MVSLGLVAEVETQMPQFVAVAACRALDWKAIRVPWTEWLNSASVQCRREHCECS
jgi:hypothetical protein